VKVDKGNSVEGAEVGEGFHSEARRCERAVQIAERVEAEARPKRHVVRDRRVGLGREGGGVFGVAMVDTGRCIMHRVIPPTQGVGRGRVRGRGA